jgi:hypothetical protein
MSGMRMPAWVTLQAQFDILTNTLGRRNKFMACLMLEIARSFHKFGVLPLLAAKEVIEKIGDDMASDVQFWTMDYVIWARLELVSTYVQNGSFFEANEILLGVEKWFKTPADELDVFTKNQYYKMKAIVVENTGSHEEVTEAYLARVDVCLKDVGPEHRHTVRALGDLERHYRKIGDVEAAERLQIEFETRWNSFCDREASSVDAPTELASDI